MSRRDLIPLLLDRPRTLSGLARETGQTPKEAASDVEHLLLSLRHQPLAVEWTPARCRKCDFRFDTKKFTKPSRCPRCRGAWIAEARLCLRRRSTAPETASSPA